jgi:hypothetical protein
MPTDRLRSEELWHGFTWTADPHSRRNDMTWSTERPLVYVDSAAGVLIYRSEELDFDQRYV